MTRYWFLAGISASVAETMNLSTSLQEQLYQKVVKAQKESVLALSAHGAK